MGTDWARTDRRMKWVLFLTSFLSYLYFYQGGGWNQWAHFATMRALVEQGTADISGYTHLTGDVSLIHGRYFSNKPPGMALSGVAPYSLLMQIERAAGWNPADPDVTAINLYLMTILLAALPAALVNVLLYVAFSRQGASQRTAALLAGAYAFGSLNWPYSGMLMSHAIAQMLVLVTWLWVTAAPLSRLRSMAAGLAMAWAIMCDWLMAPVAGAFAVYLLTRPSRIAALPFIAASATGLLGLFLYGQLAHPGAGAGTSFQMSEQFTDQRMLFGVFGSPQWERIYWITYHPMRGLFTTCPMFIVCLISLLFVRRPFCISAEQILILSILWVFLAFYLTFFGWTGGWSVGLRYALPAMPLLWLLAHRAAVRMPGISSLFIVISIIHMLAVTSVRVMSPAPPGGRPDNSDPVRECLIVLVQGRTNHTLNGFNLGEVVGLPERLHLLPVAALMAACFATAARMGDRTGNSCAESPATPASR